MLRNVRGWPARLDRHLFAAVLRTRSKPMDRVMASASWLANRSKLWAIVAGVLAVTGRRRRQRMAAASGLLGVGIASGAVNGPLKLAWRRARPSVPPGTKPSLLPLPRSYSFPSGHAASAAAFATGTSLAMPAAAPVVVPMAATVAYSRIYGGVHYPSDVLAGAAVGAAAGGLAAWIVQRLPEPGLWQVDAPTVDVPIPRRAVVLASGHAGGAAALDEALGVIKARGVTIEEVVPVEQSLRLTERLEANGTAPLVIAAGGDGTVSAAANASMRSEAILGILPLGTSNDISRSLGIPTDPMDAAEVICGGRVCRVDAGIAKTDAGTERLFLNAATVGLNVAFARTATQPALRDRFGRLTYLVAAPSAMREQRPFECLLELDGRQIAMHAIQVAVSNAPAFGGVLGMRVLGGSMTDGLLDVIAVEPLTRPRRLLATGRAAVGRPRPVRGVHTMKARAVRISATEPQEMTLDGELFGRLPAELSAHAATIQVVVPGP